MYALYKAAYTFRPGPAGFIPWLNSKILGETSMLRCRRAYAVRYGIRLSTFDIENDDERFSYDDRDHQDFL
jgi:hypothetical protein